MFNTYATSMFKWNLLATNPRDADALVVFHAGCCGVLPSVWLVLVLVYLIPDICKWTTEVVVYIESLTGRRKVDLIPPG